MTLTKQKSAGAKVGDLLEMHAVSGQAARRGEIVEVLGGGGPEHYRVRWDDRHESIVYPADGVNIVGKQTRKAGETRKAGQTRKAGKR
jgi:hypothetical protein